MTTEHEVMRLLRRADPDRGRADPPSVDGTEYLAALRTRSTSVTLIDTEPTPTQTEGRHRWLIISTAAAAAVAIVVGGLVIATRSDDSIREIAANQPTTVAQTGAVEILSPDETWGGATRGEWDARGVQRGLSMPEDISPNSALGCGLGQSGPVFFLPSHGRCVVPEGTAIFVSALGVVCSTVEGPVEGTRFFGQSEDELRDCTARELDESTDGNQQYRVNGQEVADLDSYRTASPLFTVNLPENNIFGVEPGVAQAVSESYSFIIAPPPPGEYQITFSTVASGEPEGTVNVIVEAPQVIEQPTTT